MGFTGKTNEFLNTVIDNTDFFPNLNLGEFQRVYRVPAEYETESVVTHLELSAVVINGALKEKVENWETDNFLTLNDVPAPSVNGKSSFVSHYKRAVYCFAKSELLQQYSSMIRKSEAENLAKTSPAERQYWLGQSRKSVRALLGKSNATAELL